MARIRRATPWLAGAVLAGALAWVLGAASAEVRGNVLNARLISAVRAGDGDRVSALLAAGADPNARDGAGPLSLVEAARSFVARMRTGQSSASALGPTAWEIAFDREQAAPGPVLSLLAHGARVAPPGSVDETTVYQAILAREQPGSLHVIQNRSTVPVYVSGRLQQAVMSFAKRSGAGLGPLHEAMSDHLARSAAPVWLASADARARHRYASPTYVRNLLATSAWAGFFTQFPHYNGVLLLSRPGFSHDGTIAICYRELQWGGRTAGQGDLVLLRKAGGTWRIAGWFRVWDCSAC
ncbi:MAG TPA: hypothetical protein VKT77_23365 [Chthonomonadaceae bacterium]|nr:hypothetical protein [Chthonomonadaceae bacterium]